MAAVLLPNAVTHVPALLRFKSRFPIFFQALRRMDADGNRVHFNTFVSVVRSDRELAEASLATPFAEMSADVTEDDDEFVFLLVH